MKKLIAGFWQLFKKTPLGKVIRALSPQWLVNLLLQLPVAIVANIIYGFPSRRIKAIGVTGTDGKTTTTNMLYKILKDAGEKVSLVSTTATIIGDKTYDTGFHVTSPHQFIVQELIKKAADSGSKYIILEVTSHALDQHRFLGVKFDVGVVTNITHEHLDYHKTFENYQKAKFKLLQRARVPVVNQGIKGVGGIKGKIITFGLKEGDFNRKELNLKLKVLGDYNVENALAAYAVASVLGIDQNVAKNALENFEGVVGRMEEIRNDWGIKTFVDFAHTPNGLQQALQTLRSQTKGKLISIIGAEGQRDIEKRPLLGETAARLSDFVVVTAVDPRGQLEKINQQIIAGAEKVGAKMDETLYIINNRSEAINFVINKLAKKGDTVGIFGKGHEKSINYTGVEEPWSDVEAVKQAFKNGRPS